MRLRCVIDLIAGSPAARLLAKAELSAAGVCGLLGAG
jgi:hypothetical protein